MDREHWYEDLNSEGIDGTGVANWGKDTVAWLMDDGDLRA